MDIFNNLETNQDDEKKKRLQQQIDARKNKQYENNPDQLQMDPANNQEYQVEIDPIAFANYNRNVIANSENPEEEKNRFLCATEIAKELGKPVTEVMDNLDDYINALYSKQDARLTPENSPFPTYRNAFVAIKDNYILGKNTLKQGEIGNKLMQAELDGDEGYAKRLLEEYNTYEEDNKLRQDNAKRSWITDMFKVAANSVPFTVNTGAAGLAGSLISPAAGNAAGFLYSQNITNGQVYAELRNKGVTPSTARKVAALSGSIQAAIEVGLGTVSETLAAGSRIAGTGTKAAAALVKGSDIIEKVTYDNLTGKLANTLTEVGKKAFHYGTGTQTVVNWLLRYGFNTAGEGIEELSQSITEDLMENWAYSLDKLNVPKHEADEIIAKAAESFKGGIQGALILGAVPSAINAKATAKNYQDMRKAATDIESEAMFMAEQSDNPVVSELNDVQKYQYLHDVFEEAQADKNAAENLKAKEYAETNATPEGYKEAETTTTVNEETGEETEESVAEPVYRNENGELETSQETVLEGDTTEKFYKVYDPTVEGDNLLAHVRYDIDDKNNTITIKEFNTGNNPGIAEELFDKWSRENAAGYDIKWDPIGENARNLKDTLIANNPSGANAGLNYYTSFDEVSDINARKNAIKQIDQAYKAINRNLTKEQLQSHVTILESMFKSLKRHGDIQQNTFSDFMKFVFSDEMFGNATEITNPESMGASRVRSVKELEKGLRAAIYVTQKGDYSTFVHEMAHVYRNLVGNDHFNEISEAFNVQKDENGNFKWTRDDEENFAYAFEDYLKTGKAADAKQQSIFEKIADFLREAFNALKSQITITPEIEKVFNEMLDTDDSVIANAQRAADEYEKNENNKRIAAQQETQRKKDAEIAAQDKQTKLENTDIAVEETAANSQDFPLSANEQKEIKEEKFAAEEQKKYVEDTLETSGVENKEELTDKILNGSEQEKIEAAMEAAEYRIQQETAIRDYFRESELEGKSIDETLYVLRNAKKYANDPLYHNEEIIQEMADLYYPEDFTMEEMLDNYVVEVNMETSGGRNYRNIYFDDLEKAKNFVNEMQKATENIYSISYVDQNFIDSNYQIYQEDIDFNEYEDDELLNQTLTPEERKRRKEEKERIEKEKKEQKEREWQEIEKQAFEYFDTHPSKEFKQLKELLLTKGRRYTPWYQNTLMSITARRDMELLENGLDIPKDSIFYAPGMEEKMVNTCKTYMDVCKNGINGIFSYFAFASNSHFLGTPSKPVFSSDNSFVNCRSSEWCAKNCYAANGKYGMADKIIRQEMLNKVINDKKLRSDLANSIATQYKATAEWIQNKAPLRINAVGELDQSQVYLILALNEQGLPCSVFSKRPELLVQLNNGMNIIQLSVDPSNYALAEAYPDLPLAVVYTGEDYEIEWLEAHRERFEKYHGVVLPATNHSKLMSDELINKLPKWVKEEAICPVDGKIHKIGKPGVIRQLEAAGVEHDFTNCSHCYRLNLNGEGNPGCYFMRTISDPEMFQKTYENRPREEVIGELNEETNLALKYFKELNASEEVIRRYIEDVDRLKRVRMEEYDARTKRRISESNGETLHAEIRRSKENGRTAEKSDGLLYQKVTDPELIKKLESGEMVKAYAAIQLYNDKEIYPPMAKAIDGKTVEALHIGDWGQNEEHPEIAFFYTKEHPSTSFYSVEEAESLGEHPKLDPNTGEIAWYFNLDKDGKDESGKKLTDVAARYNPYNHLTLAETPLGVLNDQFSSAYKRPNIRIAEVLVPKWDLESGYKAEKAKDPVGIMSWHEGPVSARLSGTPDERKVILSRYRKFTKILTNQEVAELAAPGLINYGISVPDNTMTPELIEELKKRNVQIIPTEDVERWNEKLQYLREMDDIEQQYRKTDKWLKAPNGEKSKLKKKQWLTVRTPSFKKWFGDWENNPQNASKVLDENGEPLIVYHGTDKKFDIFDATKSRANMDIQGNFFSPWEIDAQGYGPNVKAFYLNIKNPATEQISYKALHTYTGQNGAGIKARELLIQQGYDGVNNSNEEYITFNANQIKSATNNNGSFDIEDPSFLYQTYSQPEEVEIKSDVPDISNMSKEEQKKYFFDDKLSEDLDNKQEAVKQQYRDIMNDPAFVSMQITEGDDWNHVYYIHKSPRNDGNGKWQLSNFDKLGPYSHVNFDDIEEAFKRGYALPYHPKKVEVMYDDQIRYDNQYYNYIANDDYEAAAELLKEYADKNGYNGPLDTEITDRTDILIPPTKRIKNNWYTQKNYNDTGKEYSLFFQTQAELLEDAMNYESWQDFMEAYQDDFNPVALEDPEYHSQVPSDADAQWYQTTWELAHNIKPEESLREEEILEMVAADTTDAAAMDALFTSRMANNPDMLDEFLLRVADIVSVDLNSEAYAHIADAEEQAEVDKIVELQDFIGTQLAHGNWVSNAKRLKKGDDLTESTRNRILSLMRSAPRDYRAIYSEIMQDPQWAVDEKDSISNKLREKAKLTKYKAASPDTDFERLSPEKRRQIAEEMENEDIARKIKDGSLNLNDELDHYIKKLEKEIRQGKRDLEELEKETTEDYQRLADYETRKLLELNEKLQLAKLKVNKNNKEINRLIAKGQKISGKYQLDSQNLKADYNEIFRKFADLKETIVVTTKVEEALKRQEQVYQAKAELENKQLQKSYANEAKQLRIQLVKRAMRRVPFNRIDYTNARTIIAIQRMLEPNLLGGVNRFIGQDSPYLRGIVSGIITDADFRDKIIAYLKKTARGSEANKEFIDKIENLKTIEQFETWTKKERNYAIKKLPKENWIKELDLLKLAKEREEAIDLDIGMKEKQRASIDPKTGEARTDREGNLIMETTFELSYADEIGQMVKDAIGADMFNRLVNVPFAEWTTEDLEKLAGRINTLYKEGRDLLDAKKALKKLEADKIRMAIETAVKNTGIIINDDDTPEEKQRKQEKINKILGYSSEIKGTNENRIKKESWITRLLHGYSAANVRRVARILDGYKEGTNTQELYWKENEAYNFKTRSINNRVTAINEVLKANNITLNDLNKTVKDGRNEWTVDELLYIIAADKDFAAKEDKEGSELIDDNDDFAATSRNAVMFGNMLSATEFINLKEELKKQDDELKDRIDKGELTEEEAQNIILGTFVKNPGTQEFIAIAHARYENALAVARNFLAENPKYNALLEVISKDYTDQYDRMNQISIEEFNSPVHRVKAYVPLVRMESNGDTNANIVKEDLLATMGQSQNWVNKGMTARRVNISPLNQKPVEMGLYKTWTNSVERTEHFIAYAAYVRELNRVYKSRDAQFTRQHIENRYGKSMMKYIDNYINEVANPNANKIYDNTQQIVRTLRGKTAPAYLAWKASSIFKQAATSPWPYMQFVDPATYTAALFKCMKPGTYDAIRQKSVFMNNRRFDPLADLVDELGENSKNGWDKFIAKQSAIGMQGLEWIDWVAVAPGWLACYEKKYNELENAAQARYEAIKTQLTEENMYADISTGNFKTAEQIEAAARKETEIDTEKLAIDYADDCVRLCQPSNRSVDISPLFKSNNEFQKAVFQFQTSLNVIWQNIRYDIPYAVKQKQFKQMTGIILGYVFAGIAMNALMEGVGAGDDDEDKAIKDLIFYATTQFTDSIPLLGSAITNANQKIITGKGTFFTNGTDITPMVTKYLNVITKAAKAINESDDEKKKQAWMKAAESMAEGIGMYLGLPVQGIKEVEKLVGVGDGDGKMDISLDNIADVYGIVNNIKPKDK